MRNVQASPSARFSETGSVLPRVEIFAAGTHRGKTYTIRDLDDMVDAFRKYSASGGKTSVPLAVPAVLGHDEAAEQDLLQQTGLPAAAWCEDLWREGDTLCARLEDVPPVIAKLIKTRRYRRVSAEVYDRHPPGLPTAGLAKRMLRRIAFLGGEIPQVKTLADIPTDFSESRPFAKVGRRVTQLRAVRVVPRPEAGSFLIFSEVTEMDKEALLAKLQEFGMDTAALQGCDENALSEMVRVLGGKADDAKAAATDTPTPDASTPDATVSPTVEKQGDMTITHKDGEAGGAAGGDGATPGTDTASTPGGAGGDMAPPPADAPPEKMAAYHSAMHKKFSAMCSKMSEDPRYREIQARLDRTDAMVRQREAAERKASVNARLNLLVQSGKVLPAEREAGLDDALLAIPAEAVAKFSENGKTVEVPVLDRILTALESRPVLMKFGERVAGPAPKKAGSEDAEIAKLEEHYEQFSEQFEKSNVTRDRLIAGYKAERQRNPKLTAEEFVSV